MRDKKRIPETLDLINTIWTRYPDLRFFQLMDYLVHKYSEMSNVESPNKIDLFNLEDDLFIDFLKKLIKEHDIK